MNQKTSSVLRVIALILTSFVGGVQLARYLAYGVFYEMPLWMYKTMRFLLDHTGNTDVRDPDDISVLSMLLSLLVCWIISATVLITVYTLGCRLFRRLHRSDNRS